MSAKKKQSELDQLAINRQEQIDEFIGKVDRAMEVIKSEVEKCGVYPNNNGRLDPSEVSRRAGIKVQTLHSPNHKSTTLPRVKEFCASVIKQKAATKKRGPSKAVKEAKKWKEKFEGVNEMLELAVRERNLQELKFADAQKRIEGLEQQLRQAKNRGG